MLFSKKVFSLLLVFIFINTAYATSVSLEWQNANLPDAIRLLAKLLNMNVIVSPSVRGATQLQLSKAAPAQALALLLEANGLAKWRLGDIWLIAPRAELIKRKQEEGKWQEAEEEASPLLMHIWQLHYARAQVMGRILDGERASLLSKRGRVRVDTRTNVVLVKDTAERLKIVRQLIKYWDVPVKQIVIAARLASVDQDFERE